MPSGNIMPSKITTPEDCAKEESWKDEWVWANFGVSALSSIGKVIEDDNGLLTVKLVSGDIKVNQDKTSWNCFNMPKELLDC